MIPTANPKLGKKPKRKPRPLKRSRIKPGSTHFVDYLNPVKRYAGCYEIPAWAHAEAEGRRQAPTEAEAAIGAILSRKGLSYEREKIWPNGPKPVFSDFYLKSHHITIECDGAHHRLNKVKDNKRALWLARYWGTGTIRFWNGECMDGTAEVRIVQAFGL